MRTIKFRAFDKEKKRMFNVYVLGQDWVTEDTMDGVDEGVNVFHGREFFNRIEVMQFTGLHDKNGKEIYEGDILKTDLEGYVGVVEWIFSQWQYVYQCVDDNIRGVSSGINNGLNDEGYEDGEKSHFEVIGNIHENPDLI